MKQLSILVLFLGFFLLDANAQKVKLKDLDVKSNYIKFPAVGFAPTISAYNVQLSCDENSIRRMNYTRSGIVNSINIPGYIKYDEAVGVTVDVIIDDPTGSTAKLVTTDKKDKDGKTWQEFRYDISFSGRGAVKIISPEKTVIKEYNIPVSESISTVTQTNKAAVDKDLNGNSEKYYLDGRGRCISKVLESINGSLSYDFGLDKEVTKVELKTLKEKEHPEYNEYQSMEKTVTDAFTKMTFEDNQAFAYAIKPAIDFWIAKEPKYNGTDKEQKKLKYACQMNLAQTYYWLDDLENATKYAQMVANGDEDPKDGKKYLEKIYSLKSQFDRLKRNSRHFKIEVNSADAAKQDEIKKQVADLIAKGDIAVFPDFNTKLNVQTYSKVLKGVYTHSTNVIDTGYFVFESETDVPDFKYPGRIRFGYLKNGQISVGTPAYSRTKKLKIGENEFEVKDVKVGSGMAISVSLKEAMVQTLADFQRTTLVKIYPTSNFQNKPLASQEDLQPEEVVFNKETQKYLPLTLITGRNRAIFKIVEGCKSAEDYVTSKKEEKKSILDKLGSSIDIPMVQEALRLFDSCK